MSATVTHDAYGMPPRREPRWRDSPADTGARCAWNPWTAPKGLMIAAMVLGFIVFFPIGLVILGFMIGTGRFGRRWQRRWGMEAGAAPSGYACEGWGGRRRGSGNAAFDEYRVETLRRLEEEQQDFAAFLERLRFAKDRAEFEQFMSDRRGGTRPTEEPPPAQG